MKINVLLIAVASVLAFSAYGHADDQDYNDGLKQELNTQDVDQMYPKRPKPGQGVATTTTMEVQTVKTPIVQAAPAQGQPQAVPVVQAIPAAAPGQQIQPIYIVQQPQGVPAAQVQPVTNVEDTPVKEPKIESLRKQREDVERQTEDKMMQKLEDDRLESEKSRADRLFNGPAPAPVLAPVGPQPVVAQPQPAPLTPVQVPTNTTTVVVDTPPVTPVKHDPDVVSVEKVDGSVSPEQDNANKYTVGALVGIGSYPTVSNISGSYAAGVALGVNMPNRLGLELDGVFSNYNIQNTQPCLGFGCGVGQSLVENLNQFNLTGGLNYFLTEGRVAPFVGILAGYTRRSYSNSISYGYTSSGNSTGSNAFDTGLNAGLDVRVSEKLAVALDFRYMFNISYHMDNALTYFGPVFGSPVEGLNYYIATLGLKLAL